MGEPISGTKSVLRGSCPRKAALKAATQYAPDDGEHRCLYLREIGAHKRLPDAVQFRLHQYEVWKEPLQPHEQSVYTERTKIKHKPCASSMAMHRLKIHRCKHDDLRVS